MTRSWTGRVRRACIAIVAPALVLAGLASPARAQDFAGPAPSGLPGAAALLESGLAPASASTRLELIATRWLGLPELETRAAALGLGWRSLRAAAGVSSTGTPELGWNAAGVAIGTARHGSGAALRAVGRRDRAIDGGGEVDPAARAGVEVGGGVWISDGESLTVWASDPQLWSRGAAPPLERSLVLGLRCEFDDVSVWLARESVEDASGVRGEHTLGAALRAGPLAAWLEVRDQPLRAALGVTAHLPGLAVRGAVDSHPVLDQTIHLGLVFGREDRAP